MITAGATVTRLNWGCGPTPPPDWINADRLSGDGIQISCDIRDGLPVPDATFDYAVSIHGLQDLPYLDIVPVLQELRRVLRPGGVLRIGVPDLDRALAAYARGDHEYFYIPDAESAALGGKLIVQIIWYGSVRTPFTWSHWKWLAIAAEPPLPHEKTVAPRSYAALRTAAAASRFEASKDASAHRSSSA